MGPLARRAMRQVKIKLARKGEETGNRGVVLGAASEVLLKGIAKTRGFEALKSCRVGVPVASSVASPPNSSSSPQRRGKGRMDAKKGELKEEKSLADLMKSTDPEADKGISKMVAAVGRWWWGRCYEGEVSNNRTSIFSDKKLLEECEAWSASFKLVVACARKSEPGTQWARAAQRESGDSDTNKGSTRNASKRGNASAGRSRGAAAKEGKVRRRGMSV